MQLTTPIWLLALAAVSIPVIIHLWNIRPGKTLKVGSIALFTASSPVSSRSLKLTDILLLILRCLLLIVLAVLLAAPVWQKHIQTKATKGWLLLPRADINETYQKFKPEIDSLLKTGYEFHFFDKGFQKADTTALKKAAPAEPTAQANYWALVKQLETKAPANTSIELYTPNLITHFKGNKPSSALKINWHTYTTADSVSTWPARAWLMRTGDIRVLEGTSRPSGTSYRYSDVHNGRSDLYHLSVENGRPQVQFKGASLTVDTSVKRIAIYADRAMADAKYLSAALTAVQQFTGGNTPIRVYNNTNGLPGGLEWLYWLSDQPTDQRIISKTKNLLKYEVGKVVNVGSNTIKPVDQANSQIALYKVVRSKGQHELVWSDGFGNPVLTKETKGPTVYHLYSRFNPAWSDLVWSDEFPKWLLALTQPSAENIGAHERRVLTDEQIKPIQTSITNVVIRPENNVDLIHYFWIALILLFMAERWLATRNKIVSASE